MSGFLFILLLLVLTFLPAGFALLWFRHKKFYFRPAFFLMFFGGGVLSIVLALVFQAFIPHIEGNAKRALIFNIFLRIALSEESSRLFVFLVIFSLKNFFASRVLKSGVFDRQAVLSGGLLAGLAFAAVESAVYAAADSEIFIVRAFSSIPLHGACGARCALAANGILGNEPGGKPSAAPNFLFAVVIHGLYNFMLPRNNIFTALAVLLSITAMISSLQSVNQEEDDE